MIPIETLFMHQKHYYITEEKDPKTRMIHLLSMQIVSSSFTLLCLLPFFARHAEHVLRRWYATSYAFLTSVLA